MPINKNAAIRHRVLDQCFRNRGKKYYWEDLAEACTNAIYEYTGKDINTVSRKTIYNDINFLKSEAGGGAPIVAKKDEANANRKYYTYSDKGFSIYNIPLTKDELEQLKDALLLFSRISGLQEFDWIKDILPKLEISVGSSASQAMVSYEKNIDYKNDDLLQNFVSAIRNQTPLLVNYADFENESYSLTMHPHHLRQYNNRWFLFGEVEELRSEKGIHPVNLAVDRINDIELLKITFKKNTEINYEEYFEDFIGVTKTAGESVKIEFAVHPKRYKYLETKPLHQTQKGFRQNDSGWFQSSIELIPNKELYAQLLSFGPQLEVLTPMSIRNELKNQSGRMNQLYQNRKL